VVVDGTGAVRGELLGLRLSPDRTRIRPAGEENGPDAWVGRLLDLPPDGRRERMAEAIRADIATVLELAEPVSVPEDQELPGLGMDSLMAVSLRHELARRTGRDLPATVAFEYPTVRLLSEYLLELLATPAPAGTDETAKDEIR
jgi:acyl carrier protein